jgi:hypothetical protein
MARKTTKPPALVKALFIGNSFTGRNDLPGMLADVAASRGASLEHRLISVGGASLRMHWNKGDAAKEIDRGGYDYVVLQEQSTLPVKNAKRMHENVRLFDEVIRSAGGKTALYLTWARRHAPETQQAITDAYTAIGEETGAVVVPVGIAWQRLLRAPGRPELHDRDGSHPTPAGSYLAACVFFAALFNASPVGAGGAPGGLADADVAVLQRAAAAAVKT